VRWNQAEWVKYACWEELQGDLPRARSVWERALDVNYRSPALWLRYAEMEMKARAVNHARNVWDRAVSLLPRIDQLWYKYIHMEEALGCLGQARALFERWMAWEPDHPAWAAYAKFELRHGETERARGVYDRYVQCHPTVKAWLRYAKFEMADAGDRTRARGAYERAVTALEGEPGVADLFTRFAQFEEQCRELERARAIYRYALDHLPKSAAARVFEAYTSFEKQHGDRAGIEAVVLGKRRVAYEEAVAAAPDAYDAWFDYARLEEEAGDVARVREVYERAVAAVPPVAEKRAWRRYIYLWIKYALFEELEAGDAPRARAVYAAALRLVPHAAFSFSKLWILAAQAEVRALDLNAARRLLGEALGRAPKAKLFNFYIDLELQLGAVDRCRQLYQKYLEWAPHAVAAWVKFAQLERSLSESERARAIFELAVSQPALDMPEALWKAYIDAEIGDANRPGARALYERLLERTQHVKVWLSFAAFEAAPLPLPSTGDDAADAAAEEEAAAQAPPPEEAAEARASAARAVYTRADRALATAAPVDKEARVMLLEAWRAFEAACGDAALLRAVDERLPKRVKRRRQLTSEDGTPAGMEEYYDYIFPEEGAAAPNLKILEAAYRWKQAQAAKAAAEAAGSGDASDGDGDADAADE